jgi:glycosyltransferase involved in cell wall biosynthesis
VNSLVTTDVPLVSLGMPVYNGARYVASAIESVLSQSLSDFELIICDNASTDDTGQICQSYAAIDGRIRYFRNASNIGADPNFNRSFELSKGRYFKFVPCDDLLAPEYIAACALALQENPDASVCQTQIEFIDHAGRSLGVCRTDLYAAQAPRPSQRFAAAILSPHNCYDVMGMFRRETLACTGLLESYHGADRALVAELAIMGPFLHIPRPLLKVRDHDERYTRANVDPRVRTAWHDPRMAGTRSIPTWRLYCQYGAFLRRHRLSAIERMKCRQAMVRWWFANWNAARICVDVIAAFAPGVMGFAERFKQSFSPAPGIDQLRKARRSG